MSTPSPSPSLSSNTTLSLRVREQMASLLRQLEGNALEDEAKRLAANVELLCEDTDRLHSGVDTLISSIDLPDGLPSTLEERKAVEIQREIHEFNPSVKETIKALFMWRDAPKERIWQEEEDSRRGS